MKRVYPGMHLASIHAVQISLGQFLLSEHVRLQRDEAPPGMKTAQFGNGSFVFVGPALLRDRQAVTAAQEIRRFLLTCGQQGIQGGREAVPGEISEFKASFPGGRFREIKTQRS